MSKPPKSSPSATPYADRLFVRLNAIYGVQKVGAMFGEVDDRAVRAEWEPQLRQFAPDVIAQAIQDLVERGTEWPPTLPEFIALCRDHRREEAKGVDEALALPGMGRSQTDAETAKANLARIRELAPNIFKRMH